MGEGIVVLGSSNLDLFVRGSRLPAPGETVIGGTFYRAFGGKGANQAVAAARASRRPVTFLAAVGDDAFGEEMLAQFAHEGLDTQFVRRVSETASGVALILVDEAGENLISVASGANALLTPADVAAVPDEVFRAAGVFLTCLETPLETVAQGLARAHAAGALTILNPAPARADLRDTGVLQHVAVLSPNRGETAQITGIEPRTAADVAQATEVVRAHGCPVLVVTAASKGAWVGDGRSPGPVQVTHVPPYLVRAVDATGAGDAFNGALAVALAEERSLVEAARWASRAAAITVTRPGAQPALPTREEIERFGEGGGG